MLELPKNLKKRDAYIERIKPFITDFHGKNRIIWNIKFIKE